MKKRVLLLTTSALLSLGLLGSCNKDKGKSSEESSEESSEVVDPEADWPVKDWSDAEKSIFEEVLGSGNVIPFYYIKDQVVAKKAGKVTVTCTDSDQFSTTDLSNYQNKFLRYGYEARDDSSFSGRALHYRTKLSSSYVFDHYLDVSVEIIKNNKWVVTAMLGDEVRNNSFAGRDTPYGKTQLFAVSQAVEKYFQKSGEVGLSLPQVFHDEEDTSVTQIDFIDSRWQKAYVKAHPESGTAEYYTDPVGKPEATIVYTTTDDNIATAKANLLASYEDVGFKSIEQNDSSAKKASFFRSEDGFEADLVDQKSYTDEDTDLGVQARVVAKVSAQKVHDYSGAYKYIKNTVVEEDTKLGIGPVVENYFNADKDEEDDDIIFPDLTLGSNFLARIADNRYNDWKASGEVGAKKLTVTLNDIDDSESEARAAMDAAEWKWSALDNFYYLNDISVTFTYTARVTDPTVVPSRLVLVFEDHPDGLIITK